MSKTAELQARLAVALNSVVPEEGIDRHELFGCLYHDKEKLLAPILRDAMSRARETGTLQACPNNGPHRHVLLKFWDAFIERGMEGLKDHERTALLWPVQQHLAKVYLDWTQDPTGDARLAHPDMPASIASMMAKVPGHKTILPAHVEEVAALLAQHLIDPRSPQFEPIFEGRASGMDGRRLDLRFQGWMPVLYGMAARGDKWPVPVDLPVAPPPARHYVLQTSGQLIMFSSTDAADPLVDLLHEVTVRRVDLPPDFNADTGANQHVLNVFAATGMLTIPMGDHFPAACRDGDLIRGMTELEIPDESIEPLTWGSLDDPVFCCRSDLVAFMIRHGDLADEAEADAWLADALQDRSIVQVAVPAGDLHLYAPDGWRAEDFDTLFRAPGMSDIEGESTYFVLSPVALELAPGMAMDVALPDRSPQAEPGADLAP